MNKKNKNSEKQFILKNFYIKAFFLLLFLFSSGCIPQNEGADRLKKENIKGIREFINIIKTNDAKQVAGFVKYPLKRHYPIPDINNESEFIEKFNMLFDDDVKKMIINSNLDKDWGCFFNGCMLFRGGIWLDYTYKLIGITQISSKEEEYMINILKEQKQQLHPSVRDFQSEMLSFETDNFIIRVDQISDDKFRYASWRKNKTMSDKPDLIIHDGTINFLGSGGNHDYMFFNGHYLYIVEVNFMRSMEDPKMDLAIYRFNQPAKKIIKTRYDVLDYEDNQIHYFPATKIIRDE